MANNSFNDFSSLKDAITSQEIQMENDFNNKIGTVSEIIHEGTEDDKPKEKIKRTKPTSPELKVAHDTPPKALSMTIVGCLKDFGKCRLKVIGGESIKQSMKAFILAASYLKQMNIHVYIEPSFVEPRPIINGKPNTGYFLTVRMSPDPLV
jgi:stage V sporulation protein SpoVS